MWFWFFGVLISLVFGVGMGLFMTKKKEDTGWGKIYGVFAFVLAILIVFVLNALLRAS